MHKLEKDRQNQKIVKIKKLSKSKNCQNQKDRLKKVRFEKNSSKKII
jgi:hypothetical protein